MCKVLKLSVSVCGLFIFENDIIERYQYSKILEHSVSESEQHKLATNRLIDLANELKDEGIDPMVVSGSLMTASSIYATYVAAGNDGALEETGVDKVVDLYRRTLVHFQTVKRRGLERDHDQSDETLN